MSPIMNTRQSTPPPAASKDDRRWAAVVARDPEADDQFVYAVKTTGIYCRPSSSARLPKRSNVEFFDTPAAAEAAGYRATRRSTADRTAASAQRAELIAEACRLIEGAESPPSLDALAEQAGMRARRAAPRANTGVRSTKVLQ